MQHSRDLLTCLRAGLRQDAAVVKDASNHLIGRMVVQGIGDGPQAGFAPGGNLAISPQPTTQFGPSGIAVDVAGNVYASDTTYNDEFLATKIWPQRA